MTASRPTRRSFLKRLFGIEGVGVELAKIVSNTGTYELPATPIANPTISVTDANIKAGATIMVAINDRGGLNAYFCPVVTIPTADGGFSFVLRTGSATPSGDIDFWYIAINP